MQGLKDAGWTIVINTTRNNENDTIAEYLRKLEAPYDHINYSPENLAQDLSPTKLIGDVYLDDRNIEFNGSYDGLLKKVIDFKPWWRRIAKDA